MAAKTTRAERRAASRERIASQRAAKEAAALQQEETEKKRYIRKNLIIFCCLLVGMPVLAFGLLTVRDAGTSNRDTIEALIAANYEVQAVASIRDTSFIGYDMMVTVDNKMYECRGLVKEDLEAKKPLSCTGITVQAKS